MSTKLFITDFSLIFSSWLLFLACEFVITFLLLLLPAPRIFLGICVGRRNDHWHTFPFFPPDETFFGWCCTVVCAWLHFLGFSWRAPLMFFDWTCSSYSTTNYTKKGPGDGGGGTTFFSSNSGGLLYIYCTTGNGRDVIPQCKYTYSLSVWCDVVVHMTLSWMRAGCDGKIPFENVSSLEKTLSSSLNKRIERRWLDFAQPASTQEQSGTRCDVWVYIRCSKDLHI